MIKATTALDAALRERNFRFVVGYELLPNPILEEEGFTNVGLEDWTAGDPDGFVLNGSGIATFNEDNTEQRSGAACLRWDRTAIGAGPYVGQTSLDFERDRWYRLEYWTKGSAGLGGQTADRTYIRNATQSLHWNPTTEEWQGTWIAASQGALGTEWVRKVVWFKTGEDWDEGDNFQIMWASSVEVGEHVYVDDISLKGPYRRKGLYYSSVAFDYQGVSYEALAIKSGKIEEQRDFVIPKFGVTFSNVAKALVEYLDPEDTLTGGRLVVRLVMLDSSFDTVADQIVYQGEIEQPKTIDEDGFAIPSVGILNGYDTPIPARRMAEWCCARFAEGPDCNYSQTTLANGAGSDSTALTVDDGTNLEDGRDITIGACPPVEIASGGGTTSIVLAEARTWGNNNAVAYTDCRRDWGDCGKRERTFEYLGLRGVRFVRRKLSFFQKIAHAAISRPPRSPGITKEYSSPSTPVPILFGRRRIPGVLIESLASVTTNADSETTETQFFALSEGEIEDVVRYFADGAEATDLVESSEKLFGIYWRPGTIGLDDDEAKADYTSDPTTQERDQNRDYRTLTGTPYSRLAYVIALQDSTQEEDASETDFLFECKGVKVQPYDADGNTDGSPAYSVSPIWQLIFLAETKRLGIGLRPADIDFEVTKPEADYIGTAIASSVASTDITETKASPDAECKVTSSEGFFAGRNCTVNGVANTVADVPDDETITLGTPVAQTIGWAVIEQPERFESHIWLKDEGADAKDVVKQFLSAFRGFVTYDSGKVQFRSERGHAIDHMEDNNGTLDDWTTGDPDDWSKTETGGTVSEEATEVHTAGGSSAELARTGAGELSINQDYTGLVPGAWYLLTFWAKGSTAINEGVAVKVSTTVGGTAANWRDDSVPEDWLVQGGPGGASSRAARRHVNGDEWVRVHAFVQVRPDMASTDTFTVSIRHNDTAATGTSVFIDDVELIGPLAAWFRDFEELPDPTDLLDNGDFEDWTGSTPDDWSKNEAAGTVSEDTLNPKNGSSCVELAKTGSGDLVVYTTSLFAKLEPGRTYRLSGWARSPDDVADVAPDVYLINLDQSEYLQADGSFAAGSAQAIADGVLEDDRWTFFAIDFVVPDSYSYADTWRLYLRAVDIAVGESICYDDWKLEGPIDQVGLRQPSMGIKAKTFKTVRNHDARRKYNRAVVGFDNETDNSGDDEAVENDFDHQKDHPVKNLEVAGDCVACPDQARRLARSALLKARTLGPGAAYKGGHYGVLVQPGDIVALSSQIGGQDLDLKRVTKKKVEGLGSKDELFADLEVEDYDASVYPDSSTPPAILVPRTTGALTLTVQSRVVDSVRIASGRQVVLTWAWDDEVNGLVRYEIHKGATASFTPSVQTRLATMASRTIYRWVPTDDDIDSTVFFKIVAIFDRPYTITSNEVETYIANITDAEIDPVLTQTSRPDNLVFGGDFGDSTDWTLTQTFSTTRQDPSHDKNGSEANQFATRADARDDNSGTDSIGAGSTSWSGGSATINRCESIWYWSTAPTGNRDGTFNARLNIAKSVNGTGGNALVYYSMNNGGDWTLIGTVTSTSMVTITSAKEEDVDLTDCEIRIIGNPPIDYEDQFATTLTVTVEDVWFTEETGTGLSAEVGSSQLTIQGDGTDYSEAYRRFPGETPSDDSAVLLRSGDTLTIRCLVRERPVAANHDLEIYIREVSTQVVTVLMTIEHEDLTTSWQGFAELFTASAQLEGTFEIGIRSKSTGIIAVDQLAIFDGEVLHAFSLSPGEIANGRLTDRTRGYARAFRPGRWSGGQKRSDVT